MKGVAIIVQFVALVSFAVNKQNSPKQCKQRLWGVVHYTDVNSQGEIVKKKDMFPAEEWSSESQFDELLIEKSAAQLKGLLKSKPLLYLSVPLKKKLSLEDWPDNSSYYRIVGFRPREEIPTFKQSVVVDLNEEKSYCRLEIKYND